MQVAGTAVVAEALPVLQYVVSRCCGECLEVGKTLHPALEVGQHGLNLGLLSHQFRDHGTIERGLGSPGQRSLCACVPVEERLLESGDVGRELDHGEGSRKGAVAVCRTVNIELRRSNIERRIFVARSRLQRCWGIAQSSRSLGDVHSEQPVGKVVH